MPTLLRRLDLLRAVTTRMKLLLLRLQRVPFELTSRNAARRIEEEIYHDNRCGTLDMGRTINRPKIYFEKFSRLYECLNFWNESTLDIGELISEAA